MIIDPDFLDHWRTGMVVDALGDPMAPMYIMRLWSHCQERKSDTFAMPTRGLKAQCKFPGDAIAFEDALIDAGFLSRDGDIVTVCGWADKNASLIAAWENGGKGGRPRKNPDQTQGKPMGNPAETQREPNANPSLTQAKPIREEKRREEENTPQPPTGGDVAFDKFWSAYPKKVGKDAARKAFAKRKFGDGVLAVVLQAIAVQALSPRWTRDAGQYIPNPATWLNEGRWQDEAEGQTVANVSRPGWATTAGFANRYEAENAGCREHNAHLFREGRRAEVAA